MLVKFGKCVHSAYPIKNFSFNSLSPENSLLTPVKNSIIQALSFSDVTRIFGRSCQNVLLSFRENKFMQQYNTLGGDKGELETLVSIFGAECVFPEGGGHDLEYDVGAPSGAHLVLDHKTRRQRLIWKQERCIQKINKRYRISSHFLKCVVINFVRGPLVCHMQLDFMLIIGLSCHNQNEKNFMRCLKTTPCPAAHRL